MKQYNYWDIFILAIIILLLPIMLKDSIYLNTFNLIGIYAIAAIGLNLVMGFGGVVSLGHGAFFGLGAYSYAFIMKYFNLPPFMVLLLSVAIVCLIACIVGVPLLRLKGYFLALGTLGFGIIVYTFVNNASEMTGGPNGIAGVPVFSIGSFSFNSYFSSFYLIWVTVFIIYIINKNIIQSKEGRAFKAIHSDEQVAETLGIKLLNYKLKMFLISSAFTAVGGVYYAYYMSYISPSAVSLDTSINILIMTVLGGLGSLIGPIVGSVLFQFLNDFSKLYFEHGEIFIKGLLMMFIILFFSKGIGPQLEKLIGLGQGISSSLRNSRDL
jgi:branched-chain amino acid transport system permease protein